MMSDKLEIGSNCFYMSDYNSIIGILEYDPNWLKQFQTYALSLDKALGKSVMSIEHIGSTNIIGCAAKPIIDINKDYLN